MKKRSMLALASLATGFVVAAVTPSHAADRGPFDDLNLSSTLDGIAHLVSRDGLAVKDVAPDRDR